jgi:hypothetical protein
MYVGGIDKGDHSAMYDRQETPQFHALQKWQSMENILDHILKGDQIYPKNSTQNIIMRYHVLSEPKAVTAILLGITFSGSVAHHLQHGT